MVLAERRFRYRDCDILLLVDQEGRVAVVICCCGGSPQFVWKYTRLPDGEIRWSHVAGSKPDDWEFYWGAQLLHKRVKKILAEEFGWE